MKRSDAVTFAPQLMRPGPPRSATWRLVAAALGVLLLTFAADALARWVPTWCGPTRAAAAQEPDAEQSPSTAATNGAELATQKAEQALATPEAAGAAMPQINLFELLARGGWLMLPIAILSVIVVAVAIERGLALRRKKILPANLVRALGNLARQQTGFDPRKAYQLCQQFPSTAATIIRTMLLKLGRPHAEVEHAVAEATEREAARLYANVRTLNLAAAISPLLGLLGTVWGMIKAFLATASMPVGANKAEHLAEGIYTALVTTFAGLAVAIPAAVLAHLFEGQIQARLRDVDQLLLSLLPQVERFEGRLRTTQAPTAAATRSQQMPAVASGGQSPPPVSKVSS
jgi:biopolymer transport protein ExbB